MALAVVPDKHLIEAPAPVRPVTSVYASLPDLSREHRAEPVPPAARWQNRRFREIWRRPWRAGGNFIPMGKFEKRQFGRLAEGRDNGRTSQGPTGRLRCGRVLARRQLSRRPSPTSCWRSALVAERTFWGEGNRAASARGSFRHSEQYPWLYRRFKTRPAWGSRPVPVKASRQAVRLSP